MNSESLVRLANQYGSPLYVYNTDKIISQYKRITNAFSKVKSVKINYAVKALSNVNILKVFNQLGSGLDTVSYQEVQLGLAAGCKPEDIYKKFPLAIANLAYSIELM